MSSKVTFEELLALAMAELPAPNAARVAAAAAGDPASSEVLDRIRAIVQTMRTDNSVAPPPHVLADAIALFATRRPQPSAGPDWFARLQRVMASLVHDSRSAALAGVRGGGTAYQLAYESEMGDVDLEVERPPAVPTERRVRGQVVLHHGGHAGTVVLAAAGTFLPEASAQPDQHGVFSLAIRPGRFDVLVSVDEALLVLPDVTID